MLTLENPQATRAITEIDKAHWPQERLEARLAKHAEKHPDKVAVVDPWNRLTYKELDDYINDLAVTMQKQNIGRNSVVLMQLPNIVEAMVVFHAVLRVGAIVLPVTPIYREGEIRQILKQVKPDLIFVPEFFRKRNYIEMYENVEGLENTPIVGIKVKNEPDIKNENYIKWEDYIHNPSKIRLKPLEYDPSEYGLLMFTSGTTSAPKGVLHTHGTLGVAVSTFDGIETTNESSSFFVPSPVTHITGVVVGILGPMKLGAKAVFMPVWNVVEAYDIIEREACNYIMAAMPFLSQLIDEVEKRNKPLSSLKYFACGGADVSEYMLKKAKEVMPHCTFSRIYGSTEAPGISKFQKGYGSEEKRFSRDGRPTEPCKARLKNGEELPDGSGELEVYGPQLFMRYIDWKATEEAIDGYWFSTGDLARFDEEGFIEITGRKKDIIIRGGENYSAKEIEDILIAHPSIEDIAIVGFKDEVMGERACAFVVLKEGVKSIELKDLTDFLEQKKVAKQKWPERLEIIDELPYTHSGKVKKFELRDRLNKQR